MSNSNLHQFVRTLAFGLFAFHLAASSPARKFPAFFDRPAMDNGCKDTRSDCNWISENAKNFVDGYCQTHKKLMERWCAKTCQLCGKPPAPPEPETAEPETAEPETAKPPLPTQQPGGLSGFEENCLEAHNEFRSWHNAPRLTWSANLLRDAQRWANHLANTRGYPYHDPSLRSIGQGENLLWFSPPSPLCQGPKNENCVTCREMVKDWYDEEKDWDYARGEGNPGAAVLHFTQVVWKKSKQMAMATAVANNRLVAVARYSPPGNIGSAEDFKKNVEFPSP